MVNVYFTTACSPTRSTWKLLVYLYYLNLGPMEQSSARSCHAQLHRKRNDLVTRRTRATDGPTPLDEFPSIVYDRFLSMSIWSRALQDGSNDLFVPREVVVGNISCQSLPSPIPVNS